jgi:hypothetical protein
MRTGKGGWLVRVVFPFHGRRGFGELQRPV